MDKNSEKGVVPVLVLVAILVAFGAGAIIYYKNIYKESSIPGSQVSPLLLSLESPADGTVMTGSKVSIKGKTSPGATVVFYSDAEENSVDSDSYGNFEGSIGLTEGINTITVTAFAENGDEKSLSLDIVNDK
mgnify:FL=1